MIVETEKRSSWKAYGRKFKSLLRENVKKTGENVKLLRESVKMFYNRKETGLCVGVRPKCRCPFQFSKLIHAALVLGLVFIASQGSVWAASNDFVDFSVLASYWRATDCATSSDCSGMDFEPDGDVDEADLADFSNGWQAIDPNFLFVQETIYSTGSQDGRIWDDGTGTVGNGGANSSAADGTAIRVGDLGDSWSGLGYRSILAFDMTQLPSDSNILTARLELNRGGSVGLDPFTWGGKCLVDVNSPYFGSASGLVQADWVAVAGATAVAEFQAGDPNNSTAFDANGLNALDVTSFAQMRIYFETTINAANDPNFDYLGFYSGDYTVDPNLRPRLIVEYLTTAIFTVELDSIAADDGRVWAQDFNDANALVGTGFNATDGTSTALKLGDFESGGDLYSQRTVVSFDTSTLPDDCTILSAKLQLTKSTTDGNDPFNWGGNCYIDVNSPAIGLTDVLDVNDWQAVSDANQVAQFSTAPPVGETTMISDVFNAAGVNAISKTAKTQLKVYFAAPHNENGTVDALNFYSGEFGVAAKRPKLTIVYRVAAP